jgi:hypothetical protein
MNGRPSRRSSRGQADVSTIIILASLCAAVFACFFLLGRATSPHAQAAESTPTAVGAVAAGVPIRMSSAPAIVPAISSSRVQKRPRNVAKTPPAVAAAVPVAAAAEPVTREPVTPEPVTPGPAKTTPVAPTSTTPASSGGPGTSFDTSG